MKKLITYVIILATLGSGVHAYANTPESTENIASTESKESQITTETNADEQTILEDERAVSAVPTMTTSLLHCYIPSSTTMLSTGVVKDAKVTYSVRVQFNVKNWANQAITIGTTTSASTAKVVGSPSTKTDALGIATATYHVRGQSNFVVTVKCGSTTLSKTLKPNLAAYYDKQFTITHYFTASESKYSGSKSTSASGITDQKFKSAFLTDVRMEGMGKAQDGRYIAYSNSKYRYVSKPLNAVGTSLIEGRSIAVDNTIIPRLGSTKQFGTVEIASGYGRRQADDSGGGINGYHIDIYVGERTKNYTDSLGKLTGTTVKYLGNNLMPIQTSSIEYTDNVSSINEFIEEERLDSTENKLACVNGDATIYAYVNPNNYREVIVNYVQTGEKKSFLANDYQNAITEIKFVENEIAVTGHVNPSLFTYELYDATTGSISDVYYGTNFVHDLDGELFYVQRAPHFNQLDNGYNKILDENGRILYTTNSKTVIHGDVNIQNSKIYFSEISVINDNSRSSNNLGDSEVITEKVLDLNNLY